MKQIIQNYRTGELELAEVPIPVCTADKVLVKNITSLVSMGTERSIIDLGRKSLLGKAKARPDLVKRFLDKAKKEGFLKTFNEALGRLDNPTSLGYSSSGIVIEVGKNVHQLSPGDRVACIGAGYASHAEYIAVPEALCCKIPEGLTFEEASFGMLGIIALHGIRCGRLVFGESVAVIGLGLLGLLIIQILKAYGCKVIATDIDPHKAELGRKLGADYSFSGEDEFKEGVERATDGYGADAIIIAAATKSDVPINTAVAIARYGGRVVLVGTAEIHPQRNEMWHKEVEIIVSKGGGPGTLDPLYEEKGIDYPIGYVRWTEHRNLGEFLRLTAEKRVDVTSLISHRFRIEQAEAVYKDMLDSSGGPYIGVVLQYPESKGSELVGTREVRLHEVANDTSLKEPSEVSLGIVGAGLFGKTLLLPALKKIKGIRLHTLSTSSSANTFHTARKYGFEICTTDYREVIGNGEINTVIILTPHSLHAGMVIEALKERKHIFVEKPLCTTEQELNEIIATYQTLPSQRRGALMVGYNRRFSPHAVKVKEFLKGRCDPLVIHYRINSGFVPADHWVHSQDEGGSRVVGEVCHFVDMMQFLTGSNPVKIYAERISGNNKTALNSDNVTIVIKFEDGSIGNIVYSAAGDKAFSREYIEVFSEGKAITLNDFRETVLYRRGKKNVFRTYNQELGYSEELRHLFDVVKGVTFPLLTPEEIFVSTLAVFRINESLRTGNPCDAIMERK